MVEPLLYAALGFLTASLLALFFARALWNRAVRLTTHRLMRRLPLSREEIVASRDLLRAEQAVEHRRLERQSNLMRERMGASMAAVGERDLRIAGLRAAVEESKAMVAAGQARETTARVEIERLQGEHAVMRQRMAETERNLAATQSELQRWEQDRSDLIGLADTRRAELADTSSRMAEMRRQVSDLQRELSTAQAYAADARDRLEAALQSARQERERAERTNSRLVSAEGRLAHALTQLELDTRTRGDDGASAEDLGLLRQQIETLARDIARAAGSAPAVESAPARDDGKKPVRGRKAGAETAGVASGTR